ncbi:MAG: translation initiation factor IF-3 [Candidatus Kerfeldbacteria bacterium]|nr:translation initiation factor IF-3 [Candidatus Kerfeldbacteria bacterium]
MIDAQGNQLGVLSIADALQRAREQEVDLVEVSPLANPPVCKLINYGQLLYEKNKRERKQKAKQKKVEVKGIRLSTTIGDHDFSIRVNQSQKFLEKGHKVSIELLLRGRQKAHPEVGLEVMTKFLAAIASWAVVESPIKRQGGKFNAIVTAKK